jgi:transposase
MHIDLRQENAKLKEQITLLQQQVEASHIKIEASQLKIGYLENRNKVLEKQIQTLVNRIYGRKSEKIDPDQLLLFQQELLNESMEAVEKERTDPVHFSVIDFEKPDKRKKKRNGRSPLPKKLPRERILHEPSSEELICPCCGKERHRIGEEVTEELDYIPARLYVKEHVRGKYACRECQEGVVIGDLPARPIEKGRPGAGLLAHVVVSKYADHLPLYRQEKIFRREGVDLSRSTLCDWVGWTADLLAPIVNESKRGLLEEALIQSDDTPIRVQDDRKKGKCHIGRLWSYCVPYGEVVFDFTMNRSREGPAGFLSGFEGSLQADGYSGYNEFLRTNQVKHIGCMAHVRRKFYAALSEAPKPARIVLASIQKLYRIEAELRESKADPTMRVQVRKEKAFPILEDLETLFMELKPIALPQSELGKAISYALNQWPSIKRYTDVGEAEIDNNSCENTIRGVAVGRKNWLFCGSESGGNRAAILYSLIESCKRLDVEPFAYLKDVIDRVSTHPMSRINELTPKGWKEARLNLSSDAELKPDPSPAK